jgi:hypothetical protein
MVELDQQWFLGSGSGNGNGTAEEMLRNQGAVQYCKELGFDGGMGIRPFKSGSVSRAGNTANFSQEKKINNLQF